MPTYEFEREDGTIVEEFFHAGQVASIGEMQELEDGTTARRIPSQAQGFCRRDVGFVCYSQPREWRGDGPDPAPRRDAKGRPVLTSRREAVNFGKAIGAEYDAL